MASRNPGYFSETELEREYVDDHGFEWCRRIDDMLDMARPFT